MKDFSKGWTSDKFYITSNLKEIDHTSFYMFYNVTEISISPRNKNFLVVNKQIIIGKSDINKDEYDIVLFAAKNIQYAYIPSNIKKIGTKAFERCKYLNKIDFAKDSQLEIIDNDAFCYSSILEQICIPDNVKFIKKNAFLECKKLNKVVISNKSKLEFIGDLAFACTSITDFNLPNSLKCVKKSAFKYCCDLDINKLFPKNDDVYNNESKELIIDPNHLKEIYEYTFNKYCNMRDYDFNFNFSEDSEVRIIHNSAFEKKNINSIYFPSKLKELGKYWANNTRKLMNITISPENQNFVFIDEKIIAQKSNQKIDTIILALRDITRAKIPPYIKKINSYAFAYCDKLESIEFSENCELEIIDDYSFFSSNIKNITIPKSVRIIGKSAFGNCEIKLFQFQENSKLELIGKNAFDSLKIIYPNNDILIHPIQTYIYQDDGIKNIVFSNRADSLSGIPFQTLKTINIPPKFLNLRLLFEDNNLNEIHISPENKRFADINGKIVVKKSNINNDIYDILYYAVRNIEHVFISRNIKKIHECAFYKCKKIETFVFSEDSQLEIIEDNAFRCSSITEIEIPKRVKVIGKRAFCYCEKLQIVKLLKDSELEIISEEAFEYSNLQSIFIPKNVIIIDNKAFNSCKKLYLIDFDENSKLKYIGENAFNNVPIFKINIPKQVQIIGSNAFFSCSNLNKVDFTDDSKLKSLIMMYFFTHQLKKLKFQMNLYILDLVHLNIALN